MDTKSIGRLSCNPSIGGSKQKDILAKEIDALGGRNGCACRQKVVYSLTTVDLKISGCMVK